MCVCACVGMCVCTYICVRLCVCACVGIRVCIYICVRLCVCVCICVCTRMCACMWCVSTGASLCSYVYVHVYLCMPVSACECTHTCVCVCVCGVCVCVYLCVHVYVPRSLCMSVCACVCVYSHTHARGLSASYSRLRCVVTAMSHASPHYIWDVPEVAQLIMSWRPSFLTCEMDMAIPAWPPLADVETGTEGLIRVCTQVRGILLDSRVGDDGLCVPAP